MEMEKDFSSGDDNEYEDLEEDPIGNDNEYEDLEKNLVDFEEIFSKYKNLEEDLESVIEESSIQSELNNGEPLFEIDRDALANAKKFAQQNVSDEDEDEFSETESGEEHGEEYDEHDEVISELQDNETLSPCVIIDIFEGKIQRCNSKTNLRRLWQMIGMWQIDEEEVRAKNFTIEQLGVCYTHFMYDQNKLHSANLKQTKNRGANCEEHSYTIVGRNIQVPCIGQKKCGALQVYHPLVFSTQQSKNARYVCMNCYENKGGHTYQHIGKGVKNDPNCDNMSYHNNDTKKALEAIGYWILNVASLLKMANFLK
ncbi:hypothetical protein RhiirC2_854621 [Rhizophagus irregularis]|uniref:Uncharacterized protein n=1 Tax=Rhizophagus irregularis TaxID=588596 RepID=A0A2N1MQX9_9GLOM|nr:hypothetical protein RhiirC2_854621 [Rhizophagus irregularis]